MSRTYPTLKFKTRGKGFQAKNTLAYMPVSNVIKPFTAVSYAFSKYAKAFVPGMPFQPTLMFAGKARSLPECRTLKGAISLTHKH